MGLQVKSSNKSARRLKQFIVSLLIGFWASIAQADLLDLSAHSAFKRLYVIPEPSARNIEILVSVPVGEVDRTGPEGLAHYLEHLVVWSADKVHGEGLRNREMNAWTSPHWTTYWNSGPTDALENMIRNARAVFEPIELSQEFMLTERDVVEREFDLRYRDNPTAILYRGAYHHLYGQHGLGRSVMGTPESIRQITPAATLAFHKERYRPQDAYVVIYGPITKTDILVQIERHLQNLAQPRPVARRVFAPLPEPPENTLSLGLSALTRDEVLVVGQAAPPAGFSRRKLWFSMLLLADVLNSTQKGGLAKPLYFDDFVVTHISVQFFLLPSGDIGFEVFFRPEDGVSPQESAKRVHKVMRDLARNGLAAETFKAIQDQTRAEVRRRETAQSKYHATIAQSSILNLGQALDVKSYHYELGQPTVNDLNTLLKSIVQSPFTTTAFAYPETRND